MPYKNKEDKLANARKNWPRYYAENGVKMRQRWVNGAKIRKLLIFAHYCGGEDKIRCQCPGCDVREIVFLSIDHINGGGNKHRKLLGIFSGDRLYRWIIKNGYPLDYRVLCMNCQFGYLNNKLCPHLAIKHGFSK